MQIKVLFFAALAEALGVREQPLELPAGSTVADALERLRAAHPTLDTAGGPAATAVNLEYVARGHALSEGDELALIPPVSGG